MMSFIDENRELEEYNKDFNEKVNLRPKTNLITCTKCKESGGFINIHSSHYANEFTRCKTCYGRKYVNLDNLKSNIVDFLRPIRSLSIDEIEELNKANS